VNDDNLSLVTQSQHQTQPTGERLGVLPAQDSSFRGIVPLGVGAVGGTATAAFTANDSALFKAVVQA